MLKHWLEICYYNERDYYYAEIGDVSETDIENIQNGKIKKYFPKKIKCIGYRFFDAEVGTTSNCWEDLNGEMHRSRKNFSKWQHTNETEWTFFRTEMEEAIKKIGRYPKIEDQDKII